MNSTAMQAFLNSPKNSAQVFIAMRKALKSHHETVYNRKGAPLLTIRYNSYIHVSLSSGFKVYRGNTDITSMFIKSLQAK